MKTLTEVRREINKLAEELNEAREERDKRRVSMLHGKVEELKLFMLYLETNPRQESVLRMRDQVKHRLDVLEKRFGTWIAGRSGDTKALQQRYNSMMGIQELKHKLKALDYLCE